jgi:hypothetical protein
MIRARVEELRREPAQALAEMERGLVTGPSAWSERKDPRLLPRTIIRRFLG